MTGEVFRVVPKDTVALVEAAFELLPDEASVYIENGWKPGEEKAFENAEIGFPMEGCLFSWKRSSDYVMSITVPLSSHNRRALLLAVEGKVLSNRIWHLYASIGNDIVFSAEDRFRRD